MTLLEFFPRVTGAGIVTTNLVTGELVPAGGSRRDIRYACLLRGRIFVFRSYRRIRHPVYDHVNSVFVALIIDRVQGGVIDFPHLAHAHHLLFAAYGKNRLIVGNDWDVDAAAFE